CEGESIATANNKRRLRHGFHAARQHHVCFPQFDHLSGVHNRLHARTAQTIYGESWGFNRQSSTQPDMARAVQGVARRLLRVSKHRMIEFLGIQSSTFDGTFSGDCAEFLRGKVFQLAAIAAKGRTRPTDDGDVSWFQHGFYDESFDNRLRLEQTFQFSSGEWERQPNAPREA